MREGVDRQLSSAYGKAGTGMATVGTIKAIIEADNLKFIRSIEASQATLRTFEKHIQATSAQLDNFAVRARRAATKASVSLLALVAAGKKMLDVASAAEELDNVIVQSFGHMTGEINEWAKVTGRAMGRSVHQMREYAGVAQAMLRPMVGSVEVAAEMSKNIAKLAGDIGSFFDVADEEAFAALRSGLVGQTMPLRRFGVVLTEAQLEAFALAEGIEKTTAQMTEAEKVMLRYRFILAQTAIMHGDAERTLDSYSNTKKAVIGDIKNMAQSYGSLLLPAMTRVFENVRELIWWFDDLDEGTKKNILRIGILTGAVLGGIIAFGLLVTAVSLVVKAIVMLTSLVGVLTSPWVLAIGILIAAASMLYAAWDQDWLGLRTRISTWADTAKSKFEGLKTWWETSDFGNIVRSAWSELVAIWEDEELTLPQKALASVSIVAESIMDLIPSIREIWNTWNDSDLGLGQKVLKTVEIITEGVEGLIVSINAWWSGLVLNLARRGATLLGLEPDNVWIVNFLEDVNKIWLEQDLTLLQRGAKIARLIPGMTWYADLLEDLNDIWTDANNELTLKDKIVSSVSIIIDRLKVSAVNAIEWIGEVIVPKIETAWTITAQKGNELFAWAKENILPKIRTTWEIFVETVHEQTPGILDTVANWRDSIRQFRENLRGMTKEELQGLFDSDYSGFGGTWGDSIPGSELFQLGADIAAIIKDGFLLAWDIVALIGDIGSAAVVDTFKFFLDLGEEIANNLIRGFKNVFNLENLKNIILNALPQFVKDWFGLGTSKQAPPVGMPFADKSGSFYFSEDVYKKLGNPYLGGMYEGAILPGHSGPDQFLAMLAPGEAVVPAKAVREGWSGVLEWFREMGVPGFQGGMPPVVGGIPAIAGLDMQADLEKTSSWLTSLNEGFSTIFRTIADVFVKFFTWLGDFLIELAKSILGEEKFTQLENMWNEARKRLQDIIDIFEDTTGGFAGGAEAAGIAGDAGVVQSWLGKALDWLREQGQMAGDMLRLFSNDLLQALTPVGILNTLLGALTGAVETLLYPIIMVAEVIAAALMPVFEALFPVIKLFGHTLILVAQVFAGAWNALATVLNTLLGWIGVNIKLINTNELANAQKALAELTWEEAQAKAGLIDEIENTAKALHNIPHGFKIALARFEVAQPDYTVPGIAGVESSTIASEASPGNIIINGDVYGYEDFKRKVNQATSENKRSAHLSSVGVVG